MGDPNYVYRPWTEAQRAAARARSLARQGTAPGCRRVYGLDVPEALAPLIAKEAAKFRNRHKQSLSATRAFVRWAVGYFGATNR